MVTGHSDSERKEGNGLVIDALNTFYLRVYGVGHMVKGHSDSEREKPLPTLHGIIFQISSKELFICIISQICTRTVHTTAFY